MLGKLVHLSVDLLLISAVLAGIKVRPRPGRRSSPRSDPRV